MNKVIFAIGVVGLASLAMACSSGTEDPPPFDALPASLAGKLEAATGVKWHVTADTGGVKALVPDAPVRFAAGTPQEQARVFLEQYGKDLNAGPGEAKLADSKLEGDGVEYLRIAQTLPGTDIPIFDTSTTMSFDAEGRVEAILPSFRPDAARVSTTASVSAAAAREIAKTEWLKTCETAPKEVLTSEPVLGGVVQGSGLRLAYRVRAAGAESDCMSAEYDIDAATGAVLMTHDSQGAQDVAGGARFARGLDPNDKKTLTVTGALGVNVMSSSGQPAVTCSGFGTLGIAVTSASPGNWDDGKGAAVDGYFHTMEALRFFREGLGLNGLDGVGLGVRVVVHDNSAGNSYGMNACFKQNRNHFAAAVRLLGAPVVLPEIHIGDGGGDWLPLSAGYDVLAHELGHGVIAYSSQLVYAGESGALNESFADVMGVSAKEWSRLPGHPKGFTIGEKMMWSGKGGLRDMDNPPIYGDPDHMSKIRRCAPGEVPEAKKNDFCFVHSSSGIGNKAFSMMVKGGSHYGYGIPKATTWEASRKIWLRAMTHVPARATYLQAAEAQVAEARRFGQDAFYATACAWIAVGVLPVERIVNAKAVCQEILEFGKSKPAVGCSGIERGYSCHESASFSAYRCINGAIAGSINCKDVGKRCRPYSPTDARATVDGAGELVCD